MMFPPPVQPKLDHELPSDLPEFLSASGAESIAVISGGKSIRRDDLHREVRLLSRKLLGIGVGPGVHVGVALDRSIELIIALL